MSEHKKIQSAFLNSGVLLTRIELLPAGNLQNNPTGALWQKVQVVEGVLDLDRIRKVQINPNRKCYCVKAYGARRDCVELSAGGGHIDQRKASPKRDSGLC